MGEGVSMSDGGRTAKAITHRSYDLPMVNGGSSHVSKCLDSTSFPFHSQAGDCSHRRMKITSLGNNKQKIPLFLIPLIIIS